MPHTQVRPIRTILLATGLSQESVGAALLARRIAELSGARLHIAHVIEPQNPHDELALNLETVHEQHARDELERFLVNHGLDGAGTLHVLRGEPEHELLMLRKELDADLLVIGRYGKGGLKRGRLGSIAERVVRHCQVSSLVVQPEFRGDFTSIAVASELDIKAHEELPRAVAIAKSLGVDSITLMHAYELPHGYHTVMTREEACDRIERSYRKRAADILKTLCSDDDPEITIVLREGRPGVAIPALVEEHSINLLVIGAHYRTSKAAAALLGRTAERIIRAVPCSVWAETTPEMRESFLDGLRHLFD